MRHRTGDVRKRLTQYGWHSDVERLAEDSLHKFVRFLWTAVVDAAASK